MGIRLLNNRLYYAIVLVSWKSKLNVIVQLSSQAVTNSFANCEFKIVTIIPYIFLMKDIYVGNKFVYC